MISSDGTENEVSIQDLPNHETDPGWDSGERHQANESTDNVVPGNIFPAEHGHEKETLHTGTSCERQCISWEIIFFFASGLHQLNCSIVF